MKTLLYILALSSILFANADTASCKKCHPLIVAEFETSMHKKSSIYEDKVHKAVWDLHPAKAKGDYKCAKCHTPNATTAEEEHEGITCISCHTIMDVEKHAQANKNVYLKKPKTFFSAEPGRESQKVEYKQVTSWFGMNKTTVGSAYHDIDYTNEKFYNGEMCMGCHSHKQNSHEFSVCTTDEAGAKDKKSNCITCHMPKVDGSATTVVKTKQHAYHGFAGARVKPEMLSQYVELNFNNKQKGFEVIIDNKAPHNLMTHPLRVVQLRTVLVRDAKQIALKTHTFVKVIGKDGKPSMPWIATEVVKDTMIKANEKRVVEFDETLKAGDKIEVKLGFFVVNPKVLKKLNLQDDKELTKFTTLKSTHFNVE
ncbi:MAG: cytochrome c family protein [Sulfurimonas sp.]|uniref:multiheme c-type cytochrome n=1 Tax=Sulfurimonas sp. TaxID=2022749 RepID=UPI0026209F47|nr:multiheme c-type cytochrome [Sulfurimonas sp.]MCW8895061.1 cytochrome c family protein [Sulfurimonas sp.]MCW8954665.1 cytochrome c family protein [Sulfurimonas sp.]MCW9068455.1 cytochrome c family protein [Sulfurimonas sp.]